MKKAFVSGFVILCAAGIGSGAPTGDFTWTYETPMITGRFAGGTAAVGDTIFTIGGHEGSLYGRKNEAYNTTTETWTSRAVVPHGDGRYNMSATAVGGKVYTFGGTNIVGNYNNNNVDEYDPSTNTWVANKATLPVNISGVALSVYNGKIYSFGGGFYTAHDWWADNVYQYDPVTNTVTPKASMLTKVGCAFAATVGDYIYVIGGVGGYDASDPLTVIQRYAPLTDSWTMTDYVLDWPGGVVGGGVIDDKIYVNVSDTTALYEYDPSTNLWTDYSPILAASSQPFVAAVDNRLYVMGGNLGGPNISSAVQEGVFTPIPAPGAIVLAGIGAGVVTWLRRRRTF